MKLTFVGASLLAILAGCVDALAPGAAIRTGDTVEAPDGYLDLCRRDPNLPECGGADVVR